MNSEFITFETFLIFGRISLLFDLVSLLIWERTWKKLTSFLNNGMFRQNEHQNRHYDWTRINDTPYKSVIFFFFITRPVLVVWVTSGLHASSPSQSGFTFSSFFFLFLATFFFSGISSRLVFSFLFLPFRFPFLFVYFLSPPFVCGLLRSNFFRGYLLRSSSFQADC